MGYGYWKPYVPVAKRRARAAVQIQKAINNGGPYDPIIVTTRSIAHTFWGKAWCKNLEAYSDYQNRLPRARSYVRNGSVIDLQVLPGKVLAQVVGTWHYQVEIHITSLPEDQWKALVKDCTGSIASLVELLQGHFSDAVMQRICSPGKGLFPTPKEIRFTCSCPDWADMCKHVGAALYGVGARLDSDPKLLFTLRQVDPNDLLTAHTSAVTTAKKAPRQSRVLSEEALSDVFGLDMGAQDAPQLDTVPKKMASTKKNVRNVKTDTSSSKKAAEKKAAEKKAAEKKAAEKKAAVKKSAVKKATVKKSAVKKSVARKMTVKKAS